MIRLKHILILKRLVRSRLKLADIRSPHVAPRALEGVPLHGCKGQLIVHLCLAFFLKSSIRIRWQFRLLVRGELLILSRLYNRSALSSSRGWHLLWSGLSTHHRGLFACSSYRWLLLRYPWLSIRCWLQRLLLCLHDRVRFGLTSSHFLNCITFF